MCEAGSPAAQTIIIKTDFANAFNTRRRDLIAQALHAAPATEPLWRFFSFGYARTSKIGVYDRQGKLRDTVISAEGVKQGCPIAPLCFSLSVQPDYITAVTAGGAGGNGSAYADDLALCGPVTVASAAFAALRTRSQVIIGESPAGPHLNLDKCIAVWPWSSDIKDVPLEVVTAVRAMGITQPIQCGSINFLGARLVFSTAVAARKCLRWVVDRAEESRQLFTDILSEAVSVQAGLLLTRMCALPRMAHIARCMPPALTMEGIVHFDNLARRAVLNKLHILDDELAPSAPHGPSAAHQIHSRMAYAGLGYRRLQSVAHISYWCSLMASLPDVIAIAGGADAWSRTRQYKQARHCYELIKKNLTTARSARAPLLIPSDSSPTSIINFFVTGDPSSGPARAGYQGRITKAVESITHRAFKTKLHPADHQRIQCASGKGCSRWLTTAPTDRHNRLTDSEARLAVRGRLGLPRARHLPDQCSACREPLSPAHYQSCKMLRRRGVTNRHDAFVKGLVYAGRAAGMIAYEERPIRDEKTGSRKCPDAAFISLGNQPIQTDVTFIGVESPSYAGRDELSMLHSRAAAKTRKYKELCDRHGSRFLPCVVSTHGAMHDDARKLVSAITSARNDNGLNDDKFFSHRVLNLLSVCIQRGNAIADTMGLVNMMGHSVFTAPGNLPSLLPPFSSSSR